MVATPLFANSIRGWNIEDVCFPQQLWSVLVVVTAGAGLWVYEKHKFRWSFLISLWCSSGVVVFLAADGLCGGEVGDFSLYVMLLVCAAWYALMMCWLNDGN